MHAHPAPQLRHAPPDGRAEVRRPLSDRILRRLRAVQSACQALWSWVRATSEAPRWLPDPWRRPLSGYLLAPLIEVVAASLTLLLATLVPDFYLRGGLLLVGIVLVALTCGVGPSLLATGVGLLLLAGVILPASPAVRQGPANWVDGVVLLVSTIGLSLLAGQSGRARRWAEALAVSLSAAKASSDRERRHLRTLLEVLPVPVAMVDAQGRFLEITPASETILGDPASWARDLAEVPAYPSRRPDTGQPVARDELPIVRALTAGEITLDEELEIEAFDGQRKILLNSAAPIQDETGAIRGAVVLAQDITERKRLEEALRQAEREAAARARELEAIFEALTDGLLVYDAEGRIVRCNTAASQLLGFEAQPEFAALPWKERAVRYAPLDAAAQPVLPQDLALSRLLRGEVLAGAQTAEECLQTSDGREVWFGITGRPLRDADGTIVGAVGVARDETERRRLEREVAERAAQLQTIFESIADGVVVTDRQGRVLQMNQAFRTILGLEQQDPRGRTLPELEETAGFAGYTPAGQRLIEGAGPLPRVLRGEVLTEQQSVDTILRTRAGRETWVNVTAAPIRDATGQILGSVFVNRDVTERRRLEQQTRDTLDALLAMAQALVQGNEQAEQGAHALAGVAARLAELTRRVLDCRSVSIAAVDGQTGALTPLAVVGPSREDEHRWWAGWERAGQPRLGDVLLPDAVAALQSGEPVMPERLSKPSLLWQQLSRMRPSVLVPMRVGEALIGLLHVDCGAPEEVDATEHREALMQAVARLGALVLERERLLCERTQAQANELAAREASRRLEEFMAVAAHDLRTPLGAVVGFLDLAERQADRLAVAAREASPDLTPRAEAVRDRVADAGEGAERLSRLLGRLFDTAAIRADKLELRRAQIDLAALVGEQVAGLRAAAPGRTICLREPEGGGPVLVEADADRIGQVVANYLSNALKYAPPDRPVDVSVDVSAADGGGRRARVAVRDRGPGLPEAERARVWELFHRAPGVAVQGGVSRGSLGLGLHISKAIVEAHGGLVGVESAVGDGSTFWFTLPLASVPSAPPVAS